MSGALDHYVEVEDFRSKRPSMSVVAKLFRDIAYEKKAFAAGLTLVLIGTAVTLYEPRLFGRAIDDAILPKDVPALAKMAAAYFFLVLTRVGCLIGQQYAFEILAQSLMQRLRLRIFSLYQRLPMATYDVTPVGRLITRLTNDTSSMSEMFSSGFVTFFGNILFILGGFAWLFSLHWKLAVVSLAVFPILSLFAVRFSRQLIRIYRESRMRISSLNAFLAENILGMKIVHLFNRIPIHNERFRVVNDAYAQSLISATRVYAYFQPLITWSSGLGVALVLAVGGAMALGVVPIGDDTPGSAGARFFGTELSPGELVTFITFLLALFQPIREVVDRWTVFLSGLTSAERIYGLLDWGTEMTEAEADRPLDRGARLEGRIEFENVWFAYSGENWVLRDFCLVIEPGSRVGVVGHTGAGKTTLISLLLRFYEPQRGRILIDGRDLRDYSKRALRDRIGIIQQDVFLFSGRISDNIDLWSADATAGHQGGISSPATMRALKETEFAKPLSLNLDERGSNLSMGERQILAFARAIEKDPDVWILDEATANIDSATELRFGDALARACAGKTLLVIAHRLATIRKSDLILVLHKGALVEKGTHAELLRSGGYYSKLYRYQEAVELSAPIDGGDPHGGPRADRE